MNPPINRKLAVLLVSAAVLLLGAGILAGAASDVPLVHATACAAYNGWCGSFFRTATVDVTHVVPAGGGQAYDMPVEPDTGESFNITAYWNTDTTPCVEHSETASVDVSWSGTGWVLSNKTTTTNILDIQLCDEDTCAEEDTHSYGYRLYVKVADPLFLPIRRHNLRQVVFTTTSVDDGYELDTTSCALGAAVSPTSQTFSATDSGTFECGYSCSNSGTTLSITYE
jgi:hypothetical protein